MKNVFIFPCNPLAIDIDNLFSVGNIIMWRKPSNIACDDVVYLYIGKTLREIKYRCTVISIDVDKETQAKNQYAIPKGKLAQKCNYLLMRIESKR